MKSWFRSIAWLLWASAMVLCLSAEAHAQYNLTGIAPATAIAPSETLTYQNPNWSTAFHSNTSETFNSVSASAMQALTGVNVLNFETGSGYPTASNALNSSGNAFSATNTISPFPLTDSVSSVGLTSGNSMTMQYCTYNATNNVLGAPDATQGAFLVADKTGGGTMASGTQGLVAGSVYSSYAGGTLLTFNKNLADFGVVLKENAGISVTDLVVLYDANGVMIGRYSIGIASGSSMFFGVSSLNSLIRSVWVGQSTATNGLVIDDIAFVPGPAPANSVSYSLTGSGAMSGWGITSGCTATTGSSYLTLAGTNWNSKIYRQILASGGGNLPAGTYTLTGSGYGAIMAEITTNLSTAAYVNLNLSGTAMKNDHLTFTTAGGPLYMEVQVYAASGTAYIQSLNIATATPTAYNINPSLLKTQTASLVQERGMDSTWNNSAAALPSSYFNELASSNWGCKVVRLQLHPMSYATSAGLSFWTAWPNYLNWVITDIQEAKAAGLKVVIDLHEMPVPTTSGQDPWYQPDLGSDFGTVWQNIAQAVVNNNLTSSVWAYELLNEPNDTNQSPNVPRQWQPMAINLINTIRSIDSNTWIVYDVGPGGDFGGFNGLSPLYDSSNRIIYSAHYYFPYSFTFQQLPGSGYGGPTGYSSATVSPSLASYVAPADAFQAQWPVPIYVGEFATVRWGPEPDSSNWLNDVVSLINSRGWSWSYFAWQEATYWDLDIADTQPISLSLPYPYLTDPAKTDRGLIIYDALQPLSLSGVTTTTSIAPGETLTYQNPNWSTAFHNYGFGTVSSISASSLAATSGVNVINFETGNGFPTASNALTSTGTAFSATNTISPFALNDAISNVVTTGGTSIAFQYAMFNNTTNTTTNPDVTQGVFLVADKTGGGTMASGTQGVVAGNVYGSYAGGTLLTFNATLDDFGVVLKENAGTGVTDIIALFDDTGAILGKYTLGVSSGQSVYFGVASPDSAIKSVWIGQSTATNGLVIDDVAFVPS